MKLRKYYFKRIKSTNDSAINKIKSGILKGIVISEQQRKGRGQRGNNWISLKGNLFMSIFFEISKKISIKKMTYKNCQIVKKSLQKFTKYKILVKLPNDLLINNEKICGMLQETIFKNKKKYLIVGIGLNLVKSPKINNYPTNYLNYYALKKNSKLAVLRRISNMYEKKMNNFK